MSQHLCQTDPSCLNCCFCQGLCGAENLVVSVARGIQIPDTIPSLSPDFIWWCLIFVGSQYGTCCVSHFEDLEFRGGT